MPGRRKVHKYESFFLDLTGNIPWEELPNRGVFAVEEFAPDWMRRRFFTARGSEMLRETLALYASKGMLPDTSHVFVLTATCEADLPDPAYQGIIHAVLSGIERIKARDDRETLREIRAALERKGKSRGTVAKPESKRWLVDLLFKLASDKSKSLKELVERPRKPASASASLSRYCWEFYLRCTLFSAPDRQKWQQSRTAKVLGDEFGFRFLDEEMAEHDLSAADEAYRRGKLQVPKTDWPDARLSGPQQIG